MNETAGIVLDARRSWPNRCGADTTKSQVDVPKPNERDERLGPGKKIGLDKLPELQGDSNVLLVVTENVWPMRDKEIQFDKDWPKRHDHVPRACAEDSGVPWFRGKRYLVLEGPRNRPGKPQLDIALLLTINKLGYDAEIVVRVELSGRRTSGLLNANGVELTRGKLIPDVFDLASFPGLSFDVRTLQVAKLNLQSKTESPVGSLWSNGK